MCLSPSCNLSVYVCLACVRVCLSVCLVWNLSASIISDFVPVCLPACLPIYVCLTLALPVTVLDLFFCLCVYQLGLGCNQLFPDEEYRLPAHIKQTYFIFLRIRSFSSANPLSLDSLQFFFAFVDHSPLPSVHHPNLIPPSLTPTLLPKSLFPPSLSSHPSTCSFLRLASYLSGLSSSFPRSFFQSLLFLSGVDFFLKASYYGFFLYVLD